MGAQGHQGPRLARCDADARDLAILAALDRGHRAVDIARAWGVTRAWVSKLKAESGETQTKGE